MGGDVVRLRGVPRDPRVRVLVHSAGSARVIRPAEPVSAEFVEMRYRYELAVDRPTALRIGYLWLLAARSPRSLVHIPLRANTSTLDREPGEVMPRDLVLVHHSLGFAASAWPKVRRGLGPGRPHTADLPEVVEWDWPRDWPDYDRRANRDRFRSRVHADTLFVAGSARAFRHSAHVFFEVADEGPACLAREGRHYFADYPIGDDDALLVVYDE